MFSIRKLGNYNINLVRLLSKNNNFNKISKSNFHLGRVYQEKVDKGEIKYDTAQIALLKELEPLYNGLIELKRNSNHFNSPNTTGSIFGFLNNSNNTSTNNQGDLSLQSIYIWGGPGCGKSFCMDFFYDMIPFKKKTRVHFHHFMIDVHKSIHKIGDLKKVAAQIASKYELICFDEFQVTDIADAMILKSLFDYIFAQGTIVVSTSNRPPDDLYKNGLQRALFVPFINYLKENTKVIEVVSETDYRLGSLEEMEQFQGKISPASSSSSSSSSLSDINRASNFLNIRTEGTETLFHHLFEEARYGCPVKEEVLEVYGHKLVIPEAVPSLKLAKMPFSHICGNAFGAADYIEIAQRYQTIFINGVPQLDDRNEIRRFITLVDALYEGRCRLVIVTENCSDPFKLLAQDSLPTGDESFAYARTASRLVEMTRTSNFIGSGNKTVIGPET